MAVATSAPFVWGAGGSQMTPEEIAAQRKVAQAMIAQGSDYSPIQSWTQGASRVAQAMLGGFESRQADEASRANAKSESELISSLFGGGGAAAPAAVTAPVASPAAASGNPASAIAAIESGGKYDTLGPVTKTGDRAYGKYQVMGQNIPAWTKAHLGAEMTPDQFLANPEAQDKVFNGQFGQYSQKYGPEGAARAWFAGEGGMNNPNARDQLGTTVSAYADKFNRGMGGAQAPYQVAGPAVAPPGAAPAPVAAVAPGAPPAAPAPAAAAPAAPPGVNPRILGAMASPYVSDGTKRILGVMLQHQMTQDAVTTVDGGNKIIVMDRRGNVIKELPKGEPNKGPEYGVIGKDEFGNEQYGWRDPRDKSLTPGPKPTAAVPAGVPGAPAVAPVIPPAPPGADPKAWRENLTKAQAAAAAPATFDDTHKLRQEVTNLPSYKNLAQAAPIYKSMLDTAGTNSKASDLNLVYGLGKIFDPGSVVREGEMIMVKNTAGLPGWLEGVVNGLNGGQALTPETRQMILKEAHNRVMSYKGLYDQDATMYRGVAERNKMNPADVIQDFGTFEPWTPSQATAPAATPAPAAGPVVINGYTIKAK